MFTVVTTAVALVAVYLLLAYVALPALWRHYEHHTPLEAAPKTARTAEGIPGDPFNIGLVGTQHEILRALHAAAWHPADAITLRSSAEIIGSVLLHRPYADAPVSPLYFQNRQQDLAFEQPVGGSAAQRHHVRFWHAPELGTDDRPFWLGAATFDRSVGVSHRTGQVTHHIAANVDAERDRVIADLTRSGMLVRIYQVSGVGPTLTGHNGGGDWYFTDGELTIGVLAPDAAVQADLPATLPNPLPVAVKNNIWCWIRRRLSRTRP